MPSRNEIQSPSSMPGCTRDPLPDAAQPATIEAMQPQILVVMLTTGLLCGQQEPRSDTERVVAVLRQADPLGDDAIGTELLAPGSLDDAVRAVAQDAAIERTVRLRAMHLVRALDLANRIRGSERRDLSWWLALHEIQNELPPSVASLLLQRAFADDAARASALAELAAAGEVAQRFCSEWNETREAQDAARYDALEAELKQAAPAVVPSLFSILVVPPGITFSGPEPGQPVDARQQVRAILGLAAVLELDRALPCFVVHACGPSLTQSTHAAMAVQRFSGEHFGAAFLTPGDDAALCAWWAAHRLQHTIVLDHLQQGMLRWARAALARDDRRSATGARCAIQSLQRALGEPPDAAAADDVAELRLRLDRIDAALAFPPR